MVHKKRSTPLLLTGATQASKHSQEMACETGKSEWSKWVRVWAHRRSKLAVIKSARISWDEAARFLVPYSRSGSGNRAPSLMGVCAFTACCPSPPSTYSTYTYRCNCRTFLRMHLSHISSYPTTFRPRGARGSPRRGRPSRRRSCHSRSRCRPPLLQLTRPRVGAANSR